MQKAGGFLPDAEQSLKDVRRFMLMTEIHQSSPLFLSSSLRNTVNRCHRHLEAVKDFTTVALCQ